MSRIRNRIRPHLSPAGAIPVLLFALWSGGAGPVLGQAPAASPALRALDRGESAGARAGLAEEAAESLFLLAMAEQGDARKSAATQAAALAPAGSWIAQASTGLLAASEGRHADAATAYNAALTLHPDKRVWTLLGDSLRGAEDWDGAARAFAAAAALDPAYARALVATGDLARRKGDFAAAFNAYNHAVDDSGRPVAAVLGRAAARLQLGDKEGVLADLQRAAEVADSPADKARAWMSIVYAHTYWRELPSGLDAAERAVALWQSEGRPDSAAAVCNATGRVLLETGSAGAADWYERGWQIIDASTLPPEEKTIWRVRRLHAEARMAAANRESRRAQAVAEEARALMEADTANAEHYRQIYPYLIGYLRWQERKYEEAIAMLEQGEVDRPFIQYMIGDCYARLRDRENARLWFERALASGSGLDAESAIVRPLVSAWMAKNPAGS